MLSCKTQLLHSKMLSCSWMGSSSSKQKAWNRVPSFNHCFSKSFFFLFLFFLFFQNTSSNFIFIKKWSEKCREQIKKGDNWSNDLFKVWLLGCTLTPQSTSFIITPVRFLCKGSEHLDLGQGVLMRVEDGNYSQTHLFNTSCLPCGNKRTEWSHRNDSNVAALLRQC